MANKEKFIERALKQIQKGNLDKALVEYKSASEIDPKDVSIKLRIGDLYVKTGRVDEAIKGYLDVARANSQQGFYLKSIAVYKQVLKLDESNLDVHYRLAELYTKQRLIADAIGEYSVIVVSFDKKGKSNEALELLKKMVEIDSENVGVRLKLAENFQRQGFEADAISEYSTILVKLLEKDKLERAEAIYVDLYNAFPGNVSVLEGLAEIFKRKDDKMQYLRFAGALKSAYVEGGDLARAKEVSEAILEMNPEDEDARLFLGLESGSSFSEETVTEYEAPHPDDFSVTRSVVDETVPDEPVDEQVEIEVGAELPAGSTSVSEQEDVLPEEPEEEVEFEIPVEVEPEFEIEEAVAPEIEEAVDSVIEEKIEPVGAVETEELPEAATELEPEPEIEELTIEEPEAEEVEVEELEVEEAVEPVIEEKIEPVEAAEAVELPEEPEEEVEFEIPVEAEPEFEIEEAVAPEIEEAVESVIEEKIEPVEAAETVELPEAETELEPEIEETVELPEAETELEPEIEELEIEEPEVDVEEPEIEELEIEEPEVEIEEFEIEQIVEDGSLEFDLVDDEDEVDHERLEETEDDDLAEQAISEAIDELMEKIESEPPVDEALGTSIEKVVDDTVEEREEEYVDLSAELGLGKEDGGAAGQVPASVRASETSDEFRTGLADQLRREDTETHYNLGIAYMEMELYKEAAKEFKVALKDHNLQLDCYSRLGMLAMAESNSQEAITYFQKALKIEAGWSEDERKGCMYELALAYEAAQEKVEAAALFTEISDIDTGYREVSAKVKEYGIVRPSPIPMDDDLIEVEFL